MVENFIDAHVWASWHDKGTDAARPADEDNLDTIRGAAADPLRAGAARLSYARLNDLCNIGSSGLDPFIDRTLNEICKAIQQGLFDIGASSVPTMQRPDDPIFSTWAQFVADTMWQTYPPAQMHPSRMGRYPTADDIAGAYGAFRLLLSLATEDDVEPPTPPMTPDLGAVLDQMWKDITSDLSMIPPPPSAAGGGGSFSLDALWNAIKAELKWLGQVAEAALKALGDLFSDLAKAGAAAMADIIRPGLYLLNSILYSAYHSLRMAVVMSGYAGPFNEDLTCGVGRAGPDDAVEHGQRHDQSAVPARADGVPARPARRLVAPVLALPAVLPALDDGSGERGVTGHGLPGAGARLVDARGHARLAGRR